MHVYTCHYHMSQQYSPNCYIMGVCLVQMDKASTVVDAVLYVQEFEMQSKKLKAEIAGLEASLAGPKICHQGQPEICKKNICQEPKTSPPIPWEILQLKIISWRITFRPHRNIIC